MNNTFPSANTVFPTHERWLKTLRSHLRYYFYRYQSRHQCTPWLDYLQQHPDTNALFDELPYRHYALLYCYADKRFTPKERRQAMQYTFSFIKNKIGHKRYAQLITEKSILLTPLTESISAYFNINQIDPLEGFFSVKLKDENHERLYDLVFTLLPENKILITSLQGPKGEHAQDLVRTMTKQLHGLRPHFMLVQLITIIAQHWQCDILGIKQKSQAKYRWNDNSRLLFNYDEFWHENRALFNHDTGYWQLPLTQERKNLEEIASKKRNMYRKRYAMLDLANKEITKFCI